MSILIGLVDQEVSLDDNYAWENSKIGGLPKWMSSEYVKVECNLCGQSMSLVTQIYCPLNASPYHRCLYVFLCFRKDCSKQQKGWQVFRSQLYDSSYEMNPTNTIKKTHSDLPKDTWTDDQEDWGDDTEDGINFIHKSSKLPEADLCKTFSDSLSCKDDYVNKKRVLGPDHHKTHCSFVIRRSAHSKGETSPPATESTFSDDILKEGVLGESNILMEEMDLPDSNRLMAMAEFLNTNDEMVSESAPPGGLSVFKSYYLSVIEEPPEVTSVDVHVEDLIRKYEQDEGKQLDELFKESCTPGQPKHGEHYEKTELKHGDKMFHKFLKRLQRCPEQCIRYDRNGDPLLVSIMDSSLTIPNCPYCGCQRIFELQLLPSLIPWLKTENGSDVEIDYGTVMIYTCLNNCWPPSSDPNSTLTVMEEFIMVQTDPDHQFFR
ncbi:programmed cell death protein 2-like [Biomphalaria glabrata]|uniref:Programmed cell death protein 2-like n=1 Tax=Biomphalaria glabrata TaxID=6526 RepID=A0A9W2ZBI0_BIOGL|nr:programmed cell death protein 2-like [Biomphalaria glabrata]KAI8730609.1 programmed cell death protein 2-like [Biomphalaria glabrata]